MSCQLLWMPCCAANGSTRGRRNSTRGCPGVGPKSVRHSADQHEFFRGTARRPVFYERDWNLHREVNVVVLLDTLERNLVVESFRRGAHGVFARSDSFQALCKCISCVHEGQVWASSTELQFVLEALVDPLPIETRNLPSSRPLSKREEEIAHMVAEGSAIVRFRAAGLERTHHQELFILGFREARSVTRVELTLYGLKRGRFHGPDRKRLRYLTRSRDW